MYVAKLTMLRGRKKQFSGSDRRNWLRQNPSDLPLLRFVSFNQDSDVQVIDISRGGMLLETEMRLWPQMKVMLKLVTSQGVYKVPGCVLRSSIASLKGILRYRSAIAFDQPLQILDDLKGELAEELQSTGPESATPAPCQDASDQAPSQQASDNQCEESSAILTVIANDLA